MNHKALLALTLQLTFITADLIFLIFFNKQGFAVKNIRISTKHFFYEFQLQKSKTITSSLKKKVLTDVGFKSEIKGTTTQGSDQQEVTQASLATENFSRDRQRDRQWQHRKEREKERQTDRLRQEAPERKKEREGGSEKIAMERERERKRPTDRLLIWLFDVTTSPV